MKRDQTFFARLIVHCKPEERKSEIERLCADGWTIVSANLKRLAIHTVDPNTFTIVAERPVNGKS